MTSGSPRISEMLIVYEKNDKLGLSSSRKSLSWSTTYNPESPSDLLIQHLLDYIERNDSNQFLGDHIDYKDDYYQHDHTNFIQQ